MTSQVIFGESMEILQEEEKWYMVKLSHDGYEGWIDKKQIQTFSSNAPASNRCISTLFEIALSSSAQKVILPAGSRIFHPDEEGFVIDDEHYQLRDATNLSRRLDNIVPVALSFLGTPYLWGGRTFMGIDCSGFSQTIFNLVGKSLPRDAYQQADIGTSIAFVEETRTGDLAFFDNADGRITHVGIVIDEDNTSKKIIHASGEVRIDTLDHEGIFHEQKRKYTHHLRLIKRIL